MQKKALALTAISAGILTAFFISVLGQPFASAQSAGTVSNEGNAAWAAPPGNPAW